MSKTAKEALKKNTKPPVKTTDKSILTTFNALDLAWELCLIIAVPGVILALGGHFLDNYINSSPLFLVIGLMLALAVSSFAVYRKIIKLNADVDLFDQKK